MGAIVDNMSTVPVIGGMRSELETQAAVQSSVSIKHGSVLDFVHLLQGASIDLNALFNQFYDYDLADMGNLMQYLRSAAFNGEPSAQRLLFHLELMQSVSRSDYQRWKKLLQELRYHSNLSPESNQFVKEQDVESFLHNLLLQKLGLEIKAEPETRVNQLAFLRSLFTFLESWQSLISEDPNLIVLFQFINRYGSLPKYYLENNIPRRSVQLMAELGYDTDYLVFGQGEILSMGPSKDDQPEIWKNRLIQTIKETLGGKDKEPIIDIGFDRFKVFYQIKDDYELLKEKEDKAAGLRIIEYLIPKLEHRSAILLRNGDIVTHNQMSSLVHRLQALRKLLKDDSEKLPAPQQLRAIRSPKLLPELLFDNTRLACCLFKPTGLFHGEISLLLLDPATPMIEFWLDPYPEFLGLATLYPGKNAKGEKNVSSGCASRTAANSVNCG